MLTQPALSAMLGFLYYDEAFTLLDWSGAAAIVIALILVRLRSDTESRLRTAHRATI
jgi:drug/metabolite transporter (DMT)-like permease